MRKVELDNGQTCWAFGSAQYVKSTVQNVEGYLAKKGKYLPAKASTPLSSQYRPELDTTEELGPDDAAYFQSLIGILRWMVELGRVDLCTEVSMMSSHLCMPRKGHLEQLFHVFGYLKKHHNAEMPFDANLYSQIQIWFHVEVGSTWRFQATCSAHRQSGQKANGHFQPR